MSGVLPFEVTKLQLDRDTQRFATATTANVERFLKQRLATSADAGSRRTIAASAADVANASLARFAQLLYDRRDDGALWNVSNAWRVLIPTPWSSTRHGDYGMTDHSRRVLRLAYMNTCSGLPPRQHWLIYTSGSWFLNRRFPQLADAQAWLAAHPLTPDQWAEAADATPRRGRQGR